MDCLLAERYSGKGAMWIVLADGSALINADYLFGARLGLVAHLFGNLVLMSGNGGGCG